MFFEHQSKKEKEYYKTMLKTLGSLSRLFSENNQPALYYRATENLLCKAFGAKNLSRGDISIDASKNSIGIGIKTFGYKKNGVSREKIAEFNKDYASFAPLSAKEKVIKISELRNARIESTKGIAAVNDLFYHCIVRKAGSILVFEEPMHKIDIPKIKNIIVSNSGTISFSDGKEDYSFSVSKSTLYKKFHAKKFLFEVPVKIIDDPFHALEKLLVQNKNENNFSPAEKGEHVYLPLYSTRNGEVQERSALNQWNANGRNRNPNEVYIPVPSIIHKKFPGFFPPKDQIFNLILPDGRSLNASICQEGAKALMTNPNQDLGKWLLRDVIKVEEGHLVTYKDLAKVGIDSVLVTKLDEGNFEIDFTELSSYEDFRSSL